MRDDGRLVLQIFPRHAPDRALTYSGDQEYLHSLMQDVIRRLAAGEGVDSPPLELLEDEGPEDRDSGPPDPAEQVPIRKLVDYLLHSDEDQFFSLTITPAAADGRSYRARGRDWYLAGIIDAIASGVRMVGLVDEHGRPANATRLAELRGEQQPADSDPWDGRASAPVTDLADHLDEDEDAADGGGDDEA